MIYFFLFLVTSLLANNISHESRGDSIALATQKLEDRAIAKYMSHSDLKKELNFIELLAQFELGRFLILHGGLNGHWTHYIVNHPNKGRLTGFNSEGRRFNSLEAFLLNKAPTTLATQERYVIFKNEIQKRVKDGANFLSVPCGTMGDLVDVDYSLAQNITLNGIDIDPDSINKAKEYAASKGMNVSLSMQDAWKMDQKESFDLIVSNGLTIYENDREKVVELNKKFFDALKGGGSLITSFLTPPPGSDVATEWDMSAVNIDDALLQKTIFSDILECKWQVFTQEATFKAELAAAGFDKIEVIYDKAHIFPTVIAYKSVMVE